MTSLRCTRMLPNGPKFPPSPPAILADSRDVHARRFSTRYGLTLNKEAVPFHQVRPLTSGRTSDLVQSKRNADGWNGGGEVHHCCNVGESRSHIGRLHLQLPAVA